MSGHNPADAAASRIARALELPANLGGGMGAAEKKIQGGP